MSKKKVKKRSGSMMGRSDIPYAQRLKMRHQSDIIGNREQAAKIYMYCLCVAIHAREGVGYKRLVPFSMYFMELIKEFYADISVGMAHAKRRLSQIGIEVTGDFFSVKLPGATAKEQQIHDHALQAVQAAQYCAAVAMHDVFGFAQMRQERLREDVKKLTARYAKEGEGFLLEEMAKIGFKVVGNDIQAFIEDDGTPVLPRKWKEVQQ